MLRVYLNSTYYPPVGEDTRRVSFDISAKSMDALFKWLLFSHDNYIWGKVSKNGKYVLVAKLGNAHKETV